MASQPVPSALAGTRGATAESRVSVGAAVLAAAVPVLFVHERYQPGASLELGGADIDVSLADVAVLAVVVAAIVTGAREGFAPLRRGRAFYAALALLCLVCLAWVFLPVLRDEPTAWRAKLVAAAGFAEYALLAPALPLLLRTSRERRLVLMALVLTSAAATAWAVLQFVGAVDEFRGRRPAQREPSFVGTHDFSALSGSVLALALVALVTRERLLSPRLTVAAGVAGWLGAVLAGAMTGVLGLWLAAAALAIVGVRRYAASWRALAATAAILLSVTAGAAATRGDAIEGFAEFLGINRVDEAGQVESYAQRTLLGYIGLRIFLDHPVLGSGFQASNDEWAFGPHLAAARERFPTQPDVAFPSPEHPWGVQNLPIQSLADLGLAGFALFAAVLALGLALGLRRAPTTAQLVGACSVLVVTGVWNGVGIVPAIPLAAMTWLAFGLAALDD